MSASSRTFKKIIATRLSTNFRDATTITTVPTTALPALMKPTTLLIQNKFVGINASDINFTAGIYQPDVAPPFDCGFEAVGEVVEVGSSVKDLKPGDAVVTQSYGAFADFQVVPRRHAKKIPSLHKNYLPLDLSATTASIALEEVLRPQQGERAVVTAASGGTGQFAVQLLKKVYGCSVVGVCSSPAKAAFLSDTLGCDGVLQYMATDNTNNHHHHHEKRRKAFKEMKTELEILYPKGVNIAYESVGGDLLDLIVHQLAPRGRILSIGSISSYEQGSVEAPPSPSEKGKKPLPLRLLSKSASLHTFFLPHFVRHSPKHFERLCRLYEEGTIQSLVDPTVFRGVEGVYDAVDYMFQQKNCGKVVVEL